MTADDIAPFIIIPELPTRARHPQLTETRDSEPEPRKPRTFRDLTDHLHCPRCPLVHKPISELPLVKSCPLTIWRQRNKCCDGTWDTLTSGLWQMFVLDPHCDNMTFSYRQYRKSIRFALKPRACV